MEIQPPFRKKQGNGIQLQTFSSFMKVGSDTIDVVERLHLGIFFALNCFGTTAPLWNICITEIEMYERVHWKILRIIQGLATRCPKARELWMAGAKNIEDCWPA